MVNSFRRATEGTLERCYKISVLLLYKLGIRRGSGEVLITPYEAKEALRDADIAIVCHEKKDGIHIKLATKREARGLSELADDEEV